MDATETLQTKPAIAPSTLVLTRADLAALMTHDDYMTAAERAFAAAADGFADVPPPLHLQGKGGAFHAKGAALRGGTGPRYAALKMNANFPANRAITGLPTIQGALLLFGATNGRLLAVMDSIELTLQRTAAATALAARHLARQQSVIATICGCGEQARAQLTFLARELPLAHVHALDLDHAVATAFATDMTKQLQLDVRPARALGEAASRSDVIVTCTTAREPFLRLGDVKPGTFIAAVGADSPAKSELFPALIARSKLVVDSLEQCLVMGDLHHAVSAGAMKADRVHATLGEIVTGRKPGRRNDDEITIFDSTGTAIQDVAAAVQIHQRALARGIGLTCAFGELAPLDRDLTTPTARPREQRS